MPCLGACAPRDLNPRPSDYTSRAWTSTLPMLPLTLRSHQVPFALDSLERSYLFYDRPSTLSSNAPAFRGQSRLSGFCCANGLCVRSPCHHNSRMRTFDENSCAISITSPRSLFVPGPNKFGGITGRSPGERPHYEIAGESPACRGKSRQAGPDVNAGLVSDTVYWRVKSLSEYPFRSDEIGNMIIKYSHLMYQLYVHVLCKVCWNAFMLSPCKTKFRYMLWYSEVHLWGTADCSAKHDAKSQSLNAFS